LFDLYFEGLIRAETVASSTRFKFETVGFCTDTPAGP
jgi:hypothetical protein